MRIYTLTGQSTFDQVKRRLTADPEFAKNAQSYMSEFEQLLQEWSQYVAEAVVIHGEVVE